MGFTFTLPETNLRFGAGTLEKLGEVSKDYGRKALLVTGRSSMRRLGFLEKARQSLADAGVTATLSEGVEPNPSVETVEKGMKLGSDADLIVAIGGGSAIDAAKAMAIGIGHGADRIWPYVRGEAPITGKTKPIIAIPSTSGTGSHVTWYSVITNRATGEKAAFSSKHIYPRESIVDLDIVKTMPQDITAETGFDALAHVMESYVSRKASPMTERLCLDAMGLIAHNLARAYRDGSDADARYGMALADTYAGICITPSRTILVHAMGNVTSGLYPDMQHGRALAALSGPVMRFNIEHGDERTVAKYCDIARALGADFSEASRGNALKSIELIDDLRKEISVDKTLGELGMTEDSIGRLADLSMTLGRGAVDCNPVDPGRADIVRLFEEAM